MLQRIKLCWNIYFDPNQDPKYFYSIIKPFLLIADQISPFSPHENLMIESNELDPSIFYEFIKRRWVKPIVSSEWDSEKKRKDTIEYEPLREFTLLDKKIYANQQNYTKLKDSPRIREEIHYWSTLVTENYPGIVDRVSKLYLKDLLGVKKKYPNIPPELLPGSLGTFLPSKFFQKPYSRGDEFKAAQRIISEYLGDAITIRESGSFALFTKPSWFKIYKEVIFSGAFTILPLGNDQSEYIIQQAISEVVYEFVKGTELPKLDDITLNQIEYYRSCNAHKSMQRWIEKCVFFILYKNGKSKNRNKYKDEIISEMVALLKKTEKELLIMQTIILDFIGMILPYVLGTYSDNLWLMFLQPLSKAIVSETIGDKLIKEATKTLYRYDPVKFSFLINSFNPGYFKEKKDRLKEN